MLKSCRLYVIIDRDVIKERPLLKIVEDVFSGGADIIQLRDKSSDDGNFLECARDVKKIANKYKRLFLINDRVDIARIVDADGVHLGQNDIPIEKARKILGKKIIGASTHNLRQAREAERKGADYIGVGSIFKSETKKDSSPIGLSILHRINKAINIPFFAIGGVSLRNIAEVKKAGGDRVAVVSSAIKARDVYSGVKNLKKQLL